MTTEAREVLTTVIRGVTDAWDEPLDEVHDIPQIVNAVLAAGFRITETGETAIEWAVRSVLDVGGEHIGHAFHSEAAAEQSAERLRQIWRAGDAYENRVQSVRLVRRERTTYPDRVTEWVAVDA